MASDKGARFERLTCQRLSLWVSGRTRDDVFWRSAMSGGRATVKMRSKDGINYSAHCGDITATHETGHLLLSRFVVECKFHKDLEVATTFFGKQGKLGQFWDKLLSECHEGRLPMLVARMNRHPDIMCICDAGLAMLRRAHPDFRVYVHVAWKGFHVLQFADLLTEVDYAAQMKPALEGTTPVAVAPRRRIYITD